MIFKLQVFLGKITKLPGLPICRVFNDKKTEHYTLRRDGWVVIQGVNNKTADMLPITMVSQTLINKFETCLSKTKTKDK